MKKIAVFYDSVTGNTKKLAYHILETLTPNAKLFDSFTACDEEIICFGFWTDKGTCSEQAKQFLKNLHQKKIFLFGTAGFGATDAYFASILKRVEAELPLDNEVIGTFLCMGEMSPSVEEKYTKLLNEHSEEQKALMMLEAYHSAIGHPDKDDEKRLDDQLLQALGQVV